MTPLFGLVLVAGPRPPLLPKIYVRSDGLVHIVEAPGKNVAIAKEKDQVAVSAANLAVDRQSAGWLIHQDNCCTSYSIPTGLAIYRARKTRALGDGLMINGFRSEWNGDSGATAPSSGTGLH